MRPTRRQVAAAMIGAGFALPALSLDQVAAADAPAAPTPAALPPTLDELYQPAGLLDTALSPNGGRLASLRVLREQVANPKTGKNEPKTVEKRTAYVALYASADLTRPPTFVRIGDYDVEQVEWANDERLLIWVRMSKDARGNPTGIQLGGYFFAFPIRRVISVGADGTNPVVLFGNQPKAVKRDFDLGNVVDRLPRDEHIVLMQKWESSKDRYGLYRVDVRTGEATLVELGEKSTDGWYVQDGVPVLRFDSNYRGTTFSVFGRAPGQTDWALIRKTRRNEMERFTDLDVVGVTAQPGVVLISHREDKEEFAAIKEFDIRNLTMGRTLKSVEGADITGVTMDEAETLVAVEFMRDRRDYLFDDPGLTKHYKALNKFYKGEANVTLYDISLDHKHVIFYVTGPRQPGQFVYYNLKTQHLDVLGDQYEHLTAERLARMETLEITTRDGTRITAYLSHPIGEAKNRPMVVMPHGGPEVRDHYEWDRWAQALCARGWLVLQPNFRGSGGYGKRFGEAGRKQWGERMQQDVEDAVAHVVASGAADPNRLAIMGASYGGYAAMMGVVRQPTLYKCAVAISGDFDLIDSLAFSRKEDGADSDTYAYWVASMGDPKTDAALLRAHSPRQRVNEIVVPVMMVAGTEDTIVSPQQSRDMAKALKKAGKTYEHIELPGEGHTGWSDANEKKVLTEAMRFIGKAFG
ncbi:alpha/beta fold hydrolase [Caulobacter sp. NIBR1757]|uniref:alpha/beta hydrolase family protein n=1 Tax=Caulobacter sp. NIBR1757 TaxID=3016000 RepID=UPI0022EFE29E|nr:alpha/beta fold hydrolase [Caulobacter sp. NIBR1757]